MIRKLDIALFAIIIVLMILFGVALLIVQATPRAITVFPSGTTQTAIPMPGFVRHKQLEAST
jgi:hypothetical protein